jgi:hypothetical protein
MTVTETVYRQQLRPVIEDAATAMNRIFPPPRRVSHSVSLPFKLRVRVVP